MHISTFVLRRSFRFLQLQYDTKCRACGFATTAFKLNELTVEPTPTTPPLPPPTASTSGLKPLDPFKYGWRRHEKREQELGHRLVGSRRLRASKLSVSNLPFEQLPYQCFQEARNVLRADRKEKIAQIVEERKRIRKAEALDPSECGGEAAKKGKIIAMYKHLERLKVLADINDPMIKKRFEDGKGGAFTRGIGR